MQKKIIFVFHNGQKGGELTFDCKLRIAAAKYIASENKDAIVCFVGGGGISGSREMKKFWQENYLGLANQIFTLEKSNNTADSIKEIAEYVKNYLEEKEVILISNKYHIKRIAFFAKRNGLNATIAAAEDVLVITGEFGDEIKKYRNSFLYFWKLIMEKIAMFYIISDPDQEMVKLWRKYKRRHIE